MRRRLSALIAAVALVAALAGCAKDKGTGSGSAAACRQVTGSTLLLVAKNVKFDAECVHLAKPGKLAITFRSLDQVAHNIHVSGSGVDAKTPLEAGPMTQHLEVDLSKPGTYTYICDLHEFTMKGTIQVG